ncbi:type III secretion apparatus H+-transporting two-sector ATPase [Burkholderia ubonensis]|nr:type III secretion apparatus H+-transporting two-sector ATPase [Burkholderia ubonensis]
MLTELVSDHERFADVLADAFLARPDAVRTGKVLEVVGTLVKVGGLEVSLGELCELRGPDGTLLQHAEVIGFTRNVALLSPFSKVDHVSRATRVVALRRPLSVPVGQALLGRVVNSLGQPIDGGAPVPESGLKSVFAEPPAPMQRRMVAEPLSTGVRAVDAMITLAEGQRMGIFAPAGVGKSTLLGMFARGAQCDVNVIALIGERGREVREFVEVILGPEGMARSVVVCATSDRSSIERAKAAYVATAIAESFRDEGRRVLLMMDSLTRFARALREIGLAAGESPVRRGFPPSVFAELPRLLERAGMGERGSITALYTVLEEDESGSDPISEEVRGIVDGHMVLSRAIAAKNQYPAIDILASLSRVMAQVVPPDHVEAAGRVRQLLAQYGEVEALLQIGEYKSGTNPTADEAIAKIDAIRAFLSQKTDGYSGLDETRDALRQLAEPGG